MLSLTNPTASDLATRPEIGSGGSLVGLVGLRRLGLRVLSRVGLVGLRFDLQEGFQRLYRVQWAKRYSVVVFAHTATLALDPPEPWARDMRFLCG